jgi:hypothetical protein
MICYMDYTSSTSKLLTKDFLVDQVILNEQDVVISTAFRRCDAHRIHGGIDCNSMTHTRTRCARISRMFPNGLSCFNEESECAYPLSVRDT